MIAGTYGYRVNGRIEAKNSKSAPFKCDPKEEARLVKAGVAVYVKDTDRTVTPEDNKKGKELTEMSLDELKALAKEKDLTVNGKSKQAYIDALMNLDVEDESTDDESSEDEDADADDESSEDEDAPTFGNESTVVE